MTRHNIVNAIMAALKDELRAFTVFRCNNILQATNKFVYVEYRIFTTTKEARHAVAAFNSDRYVSMAQQYIYVFFITSEEVMSDIHPMQEPPVGWGTYDLSAEKVTWKKAAPNIKDYKKKGDNYE